MKISYLARLILILFILMPLLACTAQEDLAASFTQTSLVVAARTPDVVISSLEIGWSEPHPPDPCYIGSPAPEVSLCLTNQGDGTESVEMGYLVLPVGMVPGAEQALLGTLPGGTWSAPFGLSLTNYPGSELGAEGIIIVNGNPEPDAAAVGIIIVNNLEGQEAIVIVDSIPQPGTLQGIIIVDTHPGEAFGKVGLVTITLGEGETPSGEMSSVLWLGPLEDMQQMEDGIIWGGLVLGVDSEYIQSMPHAMPVYTPPSDDSLGAIVWGGMPEGADGIIIVNSLPGSGEAAHGIIIINKDISQVMGITMEDMPVVESGEAGIVIVNNRPAEFLEAGTAFTAAAWPGQAQEDTGSTGIVIVNNMPIGSAILPSQNYGFPEGFSVLEDMTTKMGESPFEPQPMLFVTVDLLQQGIPPALEPGAEACMSFSLGGLPVVPLGSMDGGYSVDSFFDVWAELFVAVQESGEGAQLIRQVAQLPTLPYDRCTSTPLEIVVPPPTPTATPGSGGPPLTPTATLRHGIPTYTPTLQSRLATRTP